MKATHVPVIILFAAAVAVLAASCSSVPEQKTGDDCLVVILSELVNPDNLTMVRIYRFNLSNDYPSAYANSAFSTILLREPGVELTSLSSMTGHGYQGEKSEEKVGLLLPYSPGKLVVADFVFVRTAKKTGDTTVQTDTKFRDITPEEKEDLLARLRKDPKYSSWFL